MKITLTPHKDKKVLKKVYELVLFFMHGDADSYSTEKFRFKKEEEFLVAYALIKKWLDFKEAHGNEACDLLKYDKAELKNEQLEYPSLAKKIQTAIDFLGGFESLDDMFETIQLEWPGDVTCDLCVRASLDHIESMTYFDANGNKFDINITND